MLGSRIVQLASMAWSLSFVALVLKSGLLVLPVAPASSQEPATLSIAVLENSGSFNSAAIGEAASTPDEVLAWRVILNRPNHDEVFRDIMANGTTSGRLYALAGL